jgi:hypothetical protein
MPGPLAELVSITAGRHDVLNDQAHRTVAATLVLVLERIRQDAGPDPIAVWEQLDDDERAWRRVRAVPYGGMCPGVLTETAPGVEAELPAGPGAQAGT